MGDTYAIVLAASPADFNAASALLRAEAGEIYAIGLVERWGAPVLATVFTDELPDERLLAELSRTTQDVWACSYHSATTSSSLVHVRAGEIVSSKQDLADDPCEFATNELLGTSLSFDDVIDEVEAVDPSTEESDLQARARAARAIAEQKRNEALIGVFIFVLAAVFVGWKLYR